MQESGTVIGTTLAVLLLVLGTKLADGGGRGYGGGSSGGPLLGDAKAFGCRPEVHYVTHYRTKFHDVPVYKTVIATDVVVKNQNDVVYSTVLDIRTRYLTSVVYESTTEILTRVSRSKVTKTVTEVVSVPYYTSSTQVLKQVKALDLTTHVYNTAEVHYPVTLTEVATVAATVDLPAPLFEENIVLNTITKYVTVIHTKPAYGYQNDVAYVTKHVVDYKPSYITKTHYEKRYFTYTSIVSVPSYSTETVYAPCGSYY